MKIDTWKLMKTLRLLDLVVRIELIKRRDLLELGLVNFLDLDLS